MEEIGEWEKVHKDLRKAGYRDGVDQGRNECLQKYFDESYQLCFQHYKRIGILKGTLVSHSIMASCDNNSITTSPEFKTLMAELTDEEQFISTYRLSTSEDFQDSLKALSDQLA